MDILFSVVSGIEKRAFKVHFIMIFLCYKEQTRNKASIHVFFTEYIFFHSFLQLLIVFKLSISTDRWMGFVIQKVNRRGQGEGGGYELAEICEHPFWMTPYCV